MKGYLVNFKTSGVSSCYAKCIAEDERSAERYIAKAIDDDTFRVKYIEEISFEKIPISELSAADIVRLIFATK